MTFPWDDRQFVGRNAGRVVDQPRGAVESDPSLQPILAPLRAIPKPDQSIPPIARLASTTGIARSRHPYAIRGAIWYQGESNCGRAYQYRTLFPLMIRDWREAWGEGDLAFGLVQFGTYKYNKNNVGTTCAELREAQTMTVAKVPHVGMAVTMDIGDVNDIHPKNKQEVGRRLALWAEATVYGKDVPYSGPICKSMAVEDGKVRILFDHAAGGLKTRDGKAPSDFVVAGEDQQFHPAAAVIDGHVRGLERQSRRAGGGSLRLARRRRAEPVELGGVARLPLPHRFLERRDRREPITDSCRANGPWSRLVPDVLRVWMDAVVDCGPVRDFRRAGNRAVRPSPLAYSSAGLRAYPRTTRKRVRGRGIR